MERPTAGPPLVLAAMLLAFAGFNGWRFRFELTCFDDVDFHPQFGNAEVVGVWRRGGEFLDLRPDGSFAASGSRTGYWSIREQDMPPRLAVGEATWVVFARAGALRSFPVGAQSVDPDEWNLLNVYQREPEAQSPRRPALTWPCLTERRSGPGTRRRRAG